MNDRGARYRLVSQIALEVVGKRSDGLVTSVRVFAKRWRESCRDRRVRDGPTPDCIGACDTGRRSGGAGDEEMRSVPSE
jgi:hypothetical protein